MDELKPCPFCGSQAEHRSVTDVEGSVFYETGCSNEKCCAWRAAQASTPQGSIRAWNARHESSVVAADEREEMSPDFTDSARAAIAWVLYHHQGGSSPIGQPLRFALGMSGHERLQDWRIAEAKRWAEQTGATTDRFHQPAEREPAKAPVTEKMVCTGFGAFLHALKDGDSFNGIRAALEAVASMLASAQVEPKPQPAGRDEMSPDFTDSARAAITWVLYHHQGNSSPIGQPLRFALGMDGHERLQDWRIAEAKRWAEQTGATTDRFHQPAERVPDAWRQALERALPFLDDEAGRYEDDGNNEPLDVADTIRDLLAAATSPEVAHG